MKNLLSTGISIFGIGLTTTIFMTFAKPLLAQDFCAEQGMKTYVYGQTRRYEVLICKSGSDLELYYLGGDFEGYTRIAAAYYDNKSRGYRFGNDFYRGRVTRKDFVVYRVSQNEESTPQLIINEKFQKFKQFR